MKSKNKCYTYFCIYGKFDPDNVSKLLNIENEKIHGEDSGLYEYCKEHDEIYWECGFCNKYDVYIENQMRQTIKPLLDKIDILNKIREENDVKFYLTVVPKIYDDEITPVLAPPLDVMDFCSATRTEIDLDYYISCSIYEAFIEDKNILKLMKECSIEPEYGLTKKDIKKLFKKAVK